MKIKVRLRKYGKSSYVFSIPKAFVENDMLQVNAHYMLDVEKIEDEKQEENKESKDDASEPQQQYDPV